MRTLIVLTVLATALAVACAGWTWDDAAHIAAQGNGIIIDAS